MEQRNLNFKIFRKHTKIKYVDKSGWCLWKGADERSQEMCTKPHGFDLVIFRANLMTGVKLLKKWVIAVPRIFSVGFIMIFSLKRRSS